jgi:hypothetical protein
MNTLLSSNATSAPAAIASAITAVVPMHEKNKTKTKRPIANDVACIAVPSKQTLVSVVRIV